MACPRAGGRTEFEEFFSYGHVEKDTSEVAPISRMLQRASDPGHSSAPAHEVTEVRASRAASLVDLLVVG